MPAEESPPRAKPGSSRVSLACGPCRTRHIRCDATRPYCRRCSTFGKECYYEKSRRGGLDREALAARRTRDARDATSSTSSAQTGRVESQDETPPREQAILGREPWQSLLVDNSSRSSEADAAATFLVQKSADFDIPNSLHPSAGALNDPLIDVYYEHFHGFHPCVLPRRHLQTFLHEPTKRADLEPLISVIRFIGSIYDHSSESSELKEHAKNCNSDLQSPMSLSSRAFLAQSRFLLSIALYWCTDMEGSRLVLDRAIRDAFDLGMYRRQFASENGEGDPVLEESWRRTWWQMYTVDAYYAAIKRSPKFLAQEVEASVDLPCEEIEYESGMIPVPKKLEDFDNREFALDDYVYSSFAYHIGAIRCIASATAIATQETSSKVSAKVVEVVDSIVDGWFLLLPESKRQVMGKDGIVDELMFQAHMGLHAAIVGLHRPYSSLLFNPLEIISSCSTGPPDSVMVGELVNVHTIRCLKSVEAQIRLMALPARPFCHSPFVICMMTVGTIQLLSACKFIFTTEQIEIARYQMRMTIGCLKEMAGIWPQAAVHVRELQTIAQEVLGLSSSGLDVVSGTRGNDSAEGNHSGSSVTVGPFDIQTDGAFPLDSLAEGFQQAWDNMQPDLSCYDFAPMN